MVAAAVAVWWKQSVTGSFARCVPDLSSGRQLTPASERGASREAQAFRSKQCDFKVALLRAVASAAELPDKLPVANFQTQADRVPRPSFVPCRLCGCSMLIFLRAAGCHHSV